MATSSQVRVSAMGVGALRGIVLMLIATCFWGGSSAGIAALSLGAGTPAPLLAFGGAASIACLAWLRRQHVVAEWRARPLLYVKLGVLEAINLVLLTSALRGGPLPVIVALHLCAPIFLILRELAAGRRSLSWLLALEFVLIGGGIALVVLEHPPAASTSGVLLRCVFALGSAAAVAVLIVTVGAAAREGGRDPDGGAALQLLAAAVFTAPLLAVEMPAPQDAGLAILIGLALLGPGFALYWRALQLVDPPTAAVLGHNQAVAAAFAGAMLGSGSVTITTVAAGGAVLAAVGVEQLAARRELDETKS